MGLKINLKIISILYTFTCLSLISGCGGSKKNEGLTSEPIYPFPALGVPELTKLKELSHEMEGSFMTTHIKDSLGNQLCSKKDCYFYICIRFLNDEAINQKLGKSAVPILLQISQHQNRPEAESLLLLHPQSNNHFYYEERLYFGLPDTHLTYNNRHYRIWDVQFNSFKIEKVLLAENNLDLNNYKTQMESETQSVTLALLEVASFSKRHSAPCTSWPINSFNHTEGTPSYLHDSTANTSTQNENVKNQNIEEVLKGKTLPERPKI